MDRRERNRNTAISSYYRKKEKKEHLLHEVWVQAVHTFNRQAYLLVSKQCMLITRQGKLRSRGLSGSIPNCVCVDWGAWEGARSLKTPRQSYWEERYWPWYILYQLCASWDRSVGAPESRHTRLLTISSYTCRMIGYCTWELTKDQQDCICWWHWYWYNYTSAWLTCNRLQVH